MAVSTAVLGGESKSRGAFSGRGSHAVMIAWIVMAAVAIVLVLSFSLAGLLTAAALAGVLRLTTSRISVDRTALDNLSDRRRMRFLRRHGFQKFIPVEARPVNCPQGKAFNAYRDWPDGVDGLYWLESGPGMPAVAYHYPTGEPPYLSVAFSVDGPVVGLAGDTELELSQEGFGELMAGWGSRQKLVSGIQTVTRVLPADTAPHQLWLSSQLDPDVPQRLVTDYARLLAGRTADEYVQRHYVVIRWDKDARFDKLAAAYGAGRAGWLALVNADTALALRRLQTAGYRKVHALSGPQVAAVIRHLQDPDWPIDRASDVTTASMYLPSDAEWSWVRVGQWLHRTAQIPVRSMETMPRNGLWMTPLLTGMADQVIRTLSMHIHFIPAAEAKRTAALDATGDRADLIAQENKGKIVDDATELALESAESRRDDMRNGTGHHGAAWAGFITISVTSPEAMPLAVAQVEEAADACGISKLHWLDTLQAAAQSLTWPVARALTSPRRSRAHRTAEWLSRATAGS